jgi:hypothetical protein
MVIDQWEAVFALYRTSASRRYDYGSTIHLQDIGAHPEGRSGEWRLVLIPQVQVEHQTGRYASGLNGYEAVQTHEVASKVVGDMLVERLFGPPAE